MTAYHHGNLRTALLDQAVTSIGQTGVEGLSMRALAKEIGVSHAAPGRHFANKSELLAAIVQQSYDQLTAAIVAYTECYKGGATKKLNQMARGAISWAMENRARFSVMMNPDVSRFADDQLKQSLGAFLQLIQGALQAAQAEGFRPEVKLEAILLFGVGATLGSALMMTDDLMQSVFAINNQHEMIAQIADQIIPL